MVLNRADSKVVLTAEETERTLKTEIEFRLPSSRDVPASVNRGTLLMSDNPRHPVSMQIRALALRLSGESTDAAAADDTAEAAPRGFFRRRR